MTPFDPVDEALAGRHVTYLGGLRPGPYEAMWDPDEGVWAVRVADVDVPYPCGVDCCGIETYAVVAVEPPVVT